MGSLKKSCCLMILMLLFATMSCFASDQTTELEFQDAMISEYLDGTYGKGVFVIVGDLGVIKVSTDGIEWDLVSLDDTLRLNSVIWNGEMFIAIGNMGNSKSKIVTSYNGYDWDLQDAIYPDVYNDIVWDGDSFLAVGGSGYGTFSPKVALVTNDKVLDWDIQMIKSSERLNCVIWDGERYIAGGEYGLLIQSVNGIDWTIIPTSFNKSVKDLVYDGEQYIGVVSDHHYEAIQITSQDGITWVTTDIESIAIPTEGAFLPENDRVFSLACSKYFTTDGIHWYYYPELSGRNGLYKLIYGNNQWVTIGATVLASFSDFNNGTLIEDGPSVSTYDFNYNNGLYSKIGTDFFYYSTDNSIWHSVVLDDLEARGLAYGNACYVAVGRYGKLKVSQDGLVWTDINLGTTDDLQSVKFLNGRFFAFGQYANIFTSTDGVNWTLVNSVDKIFHIGDWLFSMAWNGSTYVACGFDGINSLYFVSQDGFTWHRVDKYYGQIMYDILWDGTRFVATGSEGIISTSIDGLKWTVSSIEGQQDIKSIGYFKGNYIFAGYMHASGAALYYSENLTEMEEIVFAFGEFSDVYTTDDQIILNYNNQYYNTQFIADMVPLKAKSIVVDGNETVYIPVEGEISEPFSVIVKDKYDQVMNGKTVDWFLLDDHEGISIDNNGNLTVNESATPSLVTIVANADDQYSLFIVVVDKYDSIPTILTISGSNSVEISSTQECFLQLTSNVLDQYNEQMIDAPVTWRLESTTNDISIDENGKLTFASTTKSSDVGVVASIGELTKSFKINITQSTVLIPPGPAPSPGPAPAPMPAPMPALIPAPTSENTIIEEERKILINSEVEGKSVKGEISAESLKELTNGLSKTDKEISFVFDQSAESYELELPNLALTSKQDFDLQMVTPIGELTIPQNFIDSKSLKSLETVSLSMEKLSDKTIDSNTILELNVQINGKPIEWNSKDTFITVTVPYKLGKNESPSDITVFYKDPSGKHVNMKGVYSQGMVQFRTNHFSVFYISENKVTFEDTSNPHISSLASKGILQGKGHDLFDPNGYLTRAELIALLVNCLDLNADVAETDQFKDVNKSDWFYSAVSIGNKLEIVNGIGNDSYGPLSKVSYQDAIIMISKMMTQYKDTQLTHLTGNYENTSSYANEYVTHLIELGFIPNSFKDGETFITREEMAELVYKLFNY